MNITTSLPLEWYNKAREMNLKWSECLIRGIKEITNDPFVPSHGEEIVEESWKSKAMAIQKTMQQTIDSLNKELEDKNQK